MPISGNRAAIRRRAKASSTTSSGLHSRTGEHRSLTRAIRRYAAAGQNERVLADALRQQLDVVLVEPALDGVLDLGQRDWTRVVVSLDEEPEPAADLDDLADEAVRC